MATGALQHAGSAAGSALRQEGRQANCSAGARASISSRSFWPSIFALAWSTCCGIEPLRISTLDRYFFGNGIFTWLLSPFNLLLDVLSLPFINKGIYQLSDLPAGYQSEIKTIIETAHRRNIVGQLEKKMEGKPRGMMFFKWYGKNLDTSVEMPEYHQPFRYVRTIGVSVFSKKQSTGKHFGPLRLTLRVLYNVNTIDDRNVFIQVGDQIHYWRDEKLFIFDDTLQHQSCNESEKVRVLHVRRYPAAEPSAAGDGRVAGLRSSVDLCGFRAMFLSALDILEIAVRRRMTFARGRRTLTPLPQRGEGAHCARALTMVSAKFGPTCLEKSAGRASRARGRFSPFQPPESRLRRDRPAPLGFANCWTGIRRKTTMEVPTVRPAIGAARIRARFWPERDIG